MPDCVCLSKYKRRLVRLRSNPIDGSEYTGARDNPLLEPEFTREINQRDADQYRQYALPRQYKHQQSEEDESGANHVLGDKPDPPKPGIATRIVGIGSLAICEIVGWDANNEQRHSKEC